MATCVYCLRRPAETPGEPRCLPCDGYVRRVPMAYAVYLRGLAVRRDLDRQGRQDEVTTTSNYVSRAPWFGVQAGEEG